MKRRVLNPEWEDVNVARYELNFIRQDGSMVNTQAPYRFRTEEDFYKFLNTGDLRLTVPQYIEVEE